METIITIFNQSVQIVTKDQKLKGLVERFIKTFYTSVTEGFGFNAPPKIDVYVGHVPDYNSYFMLTKQFKHFNFYVKNNGFDLSKVKFVDEREYEVETVDYKVRPNWVFREEQLEASKFISEDPKGCKLLPLSTGSGKTVIGLKTLGDLKNKFAILIMPTFKKKWISDIKEIHDATDEEICVIQGGNDKGTYSIEQVIKIHQSGEPIPWKYYIISIPTYRNFISKFELTPDVIGDELGVSPLDFFPLLKAQAILIDETHIAFFSLFKILTYCNVKLILGLSATLIPNNDLERRVYSCIYHGKEIFHNTMIKKYIKVFPVNFDIEKDTLKKIRWTDNYRERNKGPYAHRTLEKSIMRIPKLLESYCRIIDEPYRDVFEPNYIEGDKCIIFVYTIAFATHLSKWFAKKYPNRRVERYVEDDLYEDMIQGDIIVSTIGSAGTGLDIPNLRIGIQTVNVGSPKQNIQSMGRLRMLKDRDVKFFYLFSGKIDKHVNYHEQRIELFKDRVASITPIYSSEILNMK